MITLTPDEEAVMRRYMGTIWRFERAHKGYCYRQVSREELDKAEEAYCSADPGYYQLLRSGRTIRQQAAVEAELGMSIVRYLSVHMPL